MTQSFGQSLWFSRRISNLRGRVERLKQRSQKASSNERKDLENEANTCSANLEMLRDYAINHRVGTQKDYNLAQKIDADLNETVEILQSKIVWWKRLLNVLMKALPFIRHLLILLVPLIAQTQPILAGSVTMLVLIASSFEEAGLLPPASDLPPQD